MDEAAEETVGEKHGHHRQRAPEQRAAHTDITAYIIFDMRIIPELFPENLFHEHAGGIFQHSGQQHASEKEEEGLCGQVLQERGKQDRAETVDRAQGTVDETAVYELFMEEGGVAHLNKPAGK